MPASHSSTSAESVEVVSHLPISCDPPSESNPIKTQVWVVFGATGLIGRSLTKCILSRGDKLTAVGRLYEHFLEEMQNWHDNCQGLLCDVRVKETVDAVIENSISHWGSIDIIVNCTGFGIISPCEDQHISDVRMQVEINFFGTLNIIQSSLTYFRKRKAGRYLFFSSAAGALGVPGLGPYCAAKYAMEGLVESMLYEVHSFGIRSTIVSPAPTRDDAVQDDYMSNSQKRMGGVASNLDTDDRKTMQVHGHFLVKEPSQPYSAKSSPSEHVKNAVEWMKGNEPVSVVKSAELVWQLGHCKYPPLRLNLGMFAVECIRDRLKSVLEEIEDWKYINFPAPKDERHETSLNHGQVVHEDEEDSYHEDEDMYDVSDASQ